jgi:hypothetical protein
VPFQVIIDSTFIDLWAETELSPVSNKRLLSLVNDFEEGKWRYEKFREFIFNNIAETALSMRERTLLGDQPASLLRKAAKNLRLTDAELDIGRASELAEIALYGIMRSHYKALPVVPKIFYKQNTQDNAKGADSVHIVITPDNDFTLWFGEAKFYNNIEDSRFGSVIQSIKQTLSIDKLKKENSIVTNVADIDELIHDKALLEEIKIALAADLSIDLLKPRIRIPILLLHECPLTAGASALSSSYIDAIREHHMDRALSYFSKQLTGLNDVHLYEAIHFHLVLMPVPSKQAVVDMFLRDVGLYRS